MFLLYHRVTKPQTTLRWRVHMMGEAGVKLINSPGLFKLRITSANNTIYEMFIYWLYTPSWKLFTRAAWQVNGIAAKKDMPLLSWILVPFYAYFYITFKTCKTFLQTENAIDLTSEIRIKYLFFKNLQHHLYPVELENADLLSLSIGSAHHIAFIQIKK